MAITKRGAFPGPPCVSPVRPSDTRDDRSAGVTCGRNTDRTTPDPVEPATPTDRRGVLSQLIEHIHFVGGEKKSRISQMLLYRVNAEKRIVWLTF